ncbi:CMD domain protein [Glaciibacter superstes]|uniref:CMD domain protein n=1 Tax=Glaciibacter superstes TaxID=501023 RepID=UPI0003B351EA|nr:CMD domain protein [Glaciibacter superstes]
MTATPDIIDLLAGIEPGSPVDAIRHERPETRAQAQASFDALFTPAYPGTVSEQERYAVATFVSGLHADTVSRAFYEHGLRAVDGSTGVAAAVLTELDLGYAVGPFGHYPSPRLADENTDGPRYRVAGAHRDILGSRLAAALEHAHLLVFRPREASREALQTLLDAGWSTTDVVTLSQLVAFLSFQLRVVSGLRLLGVDLNAAVDKPTTASVDTTASVSTLRGL